jgi:hypothetical protein
MSCITTFNILLQPTYNFEKGINQSELLLCF